MLSKKDIIADYKNGIKPRDIAYKYGVGLRHVYSITKHLRNYDKKSNSGDNWLGSMRPLILAIMIDNERDFSRCELCNDPIPNGNFDIHHTKYSGATYYDLKIVCRSCNLRYENTYLV